MPAVRHVSRVDLTIDPEPVPWEAENAAAIAAHWSQALAERPTMFDGLVYVATGLAVDHSGLSASTHPMRFKALTWWRHLGMPSAGFHSLFGNVILRGSDGGLLLAQTAAHTATGGMRGFPGGTFDRNDVAGDRLDPASCILRECEEETGWHPAELELDDRYLVYADDARIAVSLIAEFALPAEIGAARVRATLAEQKHPELAEIWVAHRSQDLDRISPHPYSRALADWIFAHA